MVGPIEWVHSALIAALIVIEVIRLWHDHYRGM